ncbi:transcription initiation factor IIA, gamma subunit domain-containing protein [Ditylenchus destructor]|uniref:Transcription initiation factor IIA subunit 2 n=1 Tax=Ditylenchus destructor TaxID=166010 RepID=A0AAD4R8E2_9BILA|nr:transcription initiation factor IIA, gamma subunit domain-containing protein [Ditylenchus destructor]
MSGAYQMYRSTTLGEALRQSLDELIAEGLISEQLAARVTTTFDQCINNALATRARNKVNFKAEKLRAYRFCDNVWTFVMEKVEFRDSQRPIDGAIDRVKFVACDATAKRTGGSA